MTIKAKYASKCPDCRGQIPVGAEIEWVKGIPARHAKCAKIQAPKRTQPVAPPVDTTGCSRLSRESRDRSDNYELGAVMHCAKIPGGGGNDGRYWTVVQVDKKWRDPDSEEWMIGCYVRPATPEECAPGEAKRSAAEQRKALIAELRDLMGVGVGDYTGTIPEGSEYVIDTGVHGSGREFVRVCPDGTTIRYNGGHYDDYRATLWTTTNPRAAEIVRELQGASK